MVERVAKAMHAHDVKMHGVTVAIEPPWVPYLPQARAAIEAMREPTEAMVEDGKRKIWFDSAEQIKFQATESYRAMIDAALK